MKSKKILLFIIALIGTFMININGVFALDISVSDVKVNKKGGNILLGDTSFNDKNINSSIEFNDLNDYVIYQITLKNNDSEDYTIDSIKDNNTNENISVSYSYDDKKISSKGTQNVYVTLKYNKKLYNKDSISLNDLTFTLNLLDSNGNSNSTIINPITGDSVTHYILLFIISLILIFFGLLLIKRRKSKLFLVFLIALIPSVVFAKKNLSISIKFTNITIKGEMLPYTVTIKNSNGTSTERTVVYGQPVGNLPEVSKVGYTFDKYEDQDGNEVTEDTIVKGKLTVTPKFNPITYDITYDYAGGNATNPEHYTIEDDITLSQPTRNGYTFFGWTGTNINEVQNSVRIQNSTGNLNFVARWSTNQNTPYKVIHRYPNLDGTYENVVQNLEGPTDEEVAVALLNRDGFTGPQQLTSITIVAVENEEDIPTVTYTYTRNNYRLTINNDVQTTFTNTSYPYGTEITLTAKDKDNYEFIEWSNGETTKTITFNITGNTEIYPIYSRIKYTVTYNSTEGTINPTTQEVNAGESITTLPIPIAPTGKSFEGWYTGETSGSKVNDGYTPTGNITLYARYYNDVTGAIVSPSSISILNGASETLSISNIEEEYTFSSNNTNVATVDSTGKVTGTGVGTTTITITGSSSGKTKTVNVTVESSTYTVTLNPNGGTLTTTSITQNKGTAIGELPTPTTPAGKVFDGWYTELTDGTKVTSSYTPNANVTIYARYTDDPCKTFATDSWSTIRDNLESDSNYYAVGCEKEIEMDMDNNGTNESYTVRLANSSTPEECSTEGYSQTACGPVIEFVDIITANRMNPYTNGETNGDGNKGGWEYSEMRTYVNNDIYNALPSELKNAIIDTTVVSGHGTNDRTNFTTIDKLYLLSTVEVWGSPYGDTVTTSLTRQLDYYEDIGVTRSSFSGAIKKLNNSNTVWRLRSAYYDNNIYFSIVNHNGDTGVSNPHVNGGVTPALRIGTKPSFTVTFNTDGGSSVSSRTVIYGGKATRPTSDPTKTGLVFDNWYTDDTYTTVFDFDNTVITSDTTIYAHFINPCNGFATDSWSTIRDNLESDSNYYAVGCEKEIEMDMDNNGTNESYTVRLANSSTPEECSTEGYSQTACGIVIEFVDVITAHRMNPYIDGTTNGDGTKGGWEYSEMRTYVNSDIYNALPSELKNTIIDTTVISGHHTADSTNFTTTDKLYLLSTVEVWGSPYYDTVTTSLTRQLDYYEDIGVTTSNYSGTVKKLNNFAKNWWLRSANSSYINRFNQVYSTGRTEISNIGNTNGVAPAFRIG